MGTHIQIGALKTWYDEAGDAGDALVLLHGGIVTNETWGPQLAELAHPLGRARKDRLADAPDLRRRRHDLAGAHGFALPRDPRRRAGRRSWDVALSGDGEAGSSIG
ncbi:MAG: hypothetical protein E6G04_03690 [Actinobacteria bacterium]|nr:MAG: hypothetical protein E6G04_03690 [Actinomycetota bacterium]